MQLRDVPQQRASVLLPFAAGLFIVAVAQLAVPAIVMAVTVGVLVAVGAVVPERPWRTAAIAEAPVLVLALARAVGQSIALVGVVVLTLPLVLAISVLLLKAGAGLRRERPAGGGVFATKARRGAFLIAMVAVLVVGNAVFTQRWSDAVYGRALQRQEEIRSALRGRTPQSLQAQALARAFSGAGDALPGGPYQEVRTGTEEFRAAAEVHAGLERRCIRVRVDADAIVSTAVEHGGC